jgi:hypothetical protein
VDVACPLLKHWTRGPLHLLRPRPNLRILELERVVRRIQRMAATFWIDDGCLLRAGQWTHAGRWLIPIKAITGITVKVRVGLFAKRGKSPRPTEVEDWGVWGWSFPVT